jgi:urease accessory protein
MRRGRTAVDAARSLHGRMRLRFAQDGSRTSLTSAERSPPFHVQRLLYLDALRPALAHAAVLNTTAGLFAGDRLDLAIEVKAGAAVEIMTPTNTRAYGMEEGFAESRTSIVVEPGGYLEFVPRPTILCRDAALRLRTSVVVGRGGSAVIGDIVAFGRIAAGERHHYRWLDQRTELRFDGSTILAEALRLARDDSPDATGVLGDAAVYGALHVASVEADVPSLLADLRRVIDGQCYVTGGVSTLHTGAGIAVRLLGDRPHAVYEALCVVARECRRRLAPQGTSIT